MPLPLASLIPLAVRLGLVATTTYALTRLVRSATYPGRTDQRAEDALRADMASEAQFLASLDPAKRVALAELLRELLATLESEARPELEG